MLVDLILADRRYYTFEGYAAARVTQSFDALGVAYRRIYLADGALQDYLAATEEHAPNWTLSFANLTPHHKPLCDILQIPHFYWVEGSFGPAVHFMEAEFAKVGLCDEHLCAQLPQEKAVFLPPGAEAVSHVQKRFSVVLFEDFIDTTFLEKTWCEVFAENEESAIRRAIHVENPLQAGAQFSYAEQYLKALKTTQSLKTLQGIPLDVFGDHVGCNLLLQLPPTTHLHAPLPYAEHLEVLKESAIAILDPTSPWYWSAVAAGCLPLSANREQVWHYLASPDEREKEVERLSHFLPQRTWKMQTQQLIRSMP